MANRAEQQRYSVIPHSKPCLTAKDQSAVDAVLKSGMLAEGRLVEEFQRAVSRYLGLQDGIATSSGTSALFFALKALCVGDGDEVIIPTYVCRSVWDAVRATGAIPVLCDVGDDWCMNAETAKPHITPRTRAIVVAHIFGIAADIASICSLNIAVIEDCCQAFGARCDDGMTGTFGKLCVLSFHATKLLTTGEGGMVLTNDPELLAKLRELKRGGSGRLVVRYRQPMTDLQAALGLSQLSRYNTFLQRRHSIAKFYFDHLKDLPVQLPYSIRDRSIFFRFPLRVRGDFEELRALFDAEGIQVRRGVDSLLHKQCGLESGDFPVAERCFSETLSIPLYPALSDKDCERVVNSCCDILSNGAIQNPGER